MIRFWLPWPHFHGHHSWADPERGTGGPGPLKNHKSIGFLCNTGPDPLKNHKATKPAVWISHLSWVI